MSGDNGGSVPGSQARERRDERESGPEADPAEWTTGDEPMHSAAQESYLTTLAHEAGEDVPAA